MYGMGRDFQREDRWGKEREREGMGGKRLRMGMEILRTGLGWNEGDEMEINHPVSLCSVGKKHTFEKHIPSRRNFPYSKNKIKS